MIPFIGQAPTPLPVPIAPVEHVTTMPGDVVSTWTDRVPVDGTWLIGGLVALAVIVLAYSFWRIFGRVNGPEPTQEV